MRYGVELIFRTLRNFCLRGKELYMPKVSVFMPVYKTGSREPREAIRGILNQTFTNFDFLIFTGDL